MKIQKYFILVVGHLTCDIDVRNTRAIYQDLLLH